MPFNRFAFLSNIAISFYSLDSIQEVSDGDISPVSDFMKSVYDSVANKFKLSIMNSGGAGDAEIYGRLLVRFAGEVEKVFRNQEIMVLVSWDNQTTELFCSAKNKIIDYEYESTANTAEKAINQINEWIERVIMDFAGEVYDRLVGGS